MSTLSLAAYDVVLTSYAVCFELPPFILLTLFFISNITLTTLHIICTLQKTLATECENTSLDGAGASNSNTNGFTSTKQHKQKSKQVPKKQNKNQKKNRPVVLLNISWHRAVLDEGLVAILSFGRNEKPLSMLNVTYCTIHVCIFVRIVVYSSLNQEPNYSDGQSCI